jgi:xyloglucan-specific exo-beta-1,4-glucanase
MIGPHAEESDGGVNELVSPREGAHLISGFQGIGGFTHWDLNRAPVGITSNPQLKDTESLSSAVDCPLLVVRAGKGSSKSGGYSYDGGATWNEFATEPPGALGGSIVFNSTAQVIVWSTGGSTSRSFDFGKSWGKCEGLVGNVELVADGVTPTRTYALSGSELYSSDDTAGAFQPVDSIGLPAQHERMRATEYQVGDLWIPAQTGLFHSVDAGKSFQKLPNLDSVESVGFGKPAPGKVYPTLFMNGKCDGVLGVFRSNDIGHSWTQISDPTNGIDIHGIVTGDPRIYGRVYLGTKDHGILYADPK